MLNWLLLGWIYTLVDTMFLVGDRLLEIGCYCRFACFQDCDILAVIAEILVQEQKFLSQKGAFSSLLCS